MKHNIIIVIFIFFFINSIHAQDYLKYIPFQNIDSLNNIELKYLRNEIYARNGHCFKDETLRRRFIKESWYHEKKDIKVTFDMLTSLEQQYLNKINELERSEYAHLALLRNLYNIFYKENANSVFFDDYKIFSPKSFSLANVYPYTSLQKNEHLFGNVFAKMSKKYSYDYDISDDSVKTWVTTYSFDGIVVKTYGDMIISMLCYSNKYETNDGFKVGMPIGMIQIKYPDITICDSDKGKIYVHTDYITLTIGYENNLIAWISIEANI